MGLHYKTEGQGEPIILLHGLFGNLDNLAVLARSLVTHYQIIQVDLRNHGLSCWADEMNYTLMAEDVKQLMTQLSLERAIFIGHSMGGKVAMKLAEQFPSMIEAMIILDIAPVSYQKEAHLAIFEAINTCINQHISDKKQITQIMQTYLSRPTVQFLLKSYQDEQWRFNISAIEKNYSNICDWQSISPYHNAVLFIKGSESDYLSDEYQIEILGQFPYATFETINGAGHNVHAEKPQEVIALIKNWLN